MPAHKKTETRSEAVSLNFTEAEMGAIKQLALRMGEPVAVYLRGICLAYIDAVETSAAESAAAAPVEETWRERMGLR
jgi:hypothetical protein